MSLELNSDDVALENRFLRACEYVTAHGASMSRDSLTPLYGYFKQATVGPCGTQKPSSLFGPSAKIKWKSWSTLGTMPKRVAMRRYVERLSELAIDWNLGASAETPATTTLAPPQNRVGWGVCVSAPSRQEDDEIADSAKDIFDWVKEGDLSRVKRLSGDVSTNSPDDVELTLLLWPADHGHLDVVEYLVTEMKADVNCVDGDGQTPLHYAAACGHRQVCQFLVRARAEMAAKDNDGLSPADVAEEASIKELLRGLAIS